VVEQITAPPVLDFLASVADNDTFSGKQRAYFVVSYLVVAGCPQMKEFFTEDRYRDLVGVLAESADRDFLAGALMAIQVIVREEESRCSRKSEKNRLVELLVDAGILEFLNYFTPTDQTLMELRDLVSDSIEQALIYDRL
jgi:hypothetical protein